MERTVKTWINILLFIFLILVLSVLISYNPENYTNLLILSSVLMISVSLRYLFFYESARYYKFGLISILFDAIIVYYISLMDKLGISQIYYLALICDSILFYRTVYSIIITISVFVTYLAVVYFSKNLAGIKEFIPYALTCFISILFIVVVMSIVKYAINQHHKLKAAMEKLEAAHKQLEEASCRLEQMAVIEERNRIAGHVHDTIGHTLTTVLIEIEAGKCILHKDPTGAFEKFELAQAQVRKGLDSIAQSVKTICVDNDSTGGFISSMERLIKETELHTGILISYEITDIPQISNEMQKVLYRALKEGITNGIRHGQCEKMDFLLEAANSKISFMLRDYGKGCESILPGFGLKTMRDRIEALDGSMTVTSQTGCGCVLNIELPYERI